MDNYYHLGSGYLFQVMLDPQLGEALKEELRTGNVTVPYKNNPWPDWDPRTLLKTMYTEDQLREMLRIVKEAPKVPRTPQNSGTLSKTSVQYVQIPEPLRSQIYGTD